MINGIVFIILINIQKFIHEMGHLLLAKRAGVGIEEFGIGYRPRLFKLHQSDETLYSLNLIPLGYFVKMKGLKTKEETDAFASKDKRTKLSILAVGPLVNISTLVVFMIPSIFLFAFVYLSGVPEPKIITNEVGEKLVPARTVIGYVAPESPAEENGLQIGDVIVGADDSEFNYSGQLKSFIDQNKGHEIVLHIERQGEIINVPVVPRENPPENQGALGIRFYEDKEFEIVSYPFWKAILKGADITLQNIWYFTKVPFNVFVGQSSIEQFRPATTEEVSQYMNGSSSDTEFDNKSFRAFTLLGTMSVIAITPIVIFTAISLLPIPGWDIWRILAIIFQT